MLNLIDDPVLLIPESNIHVENRYSLLAMEKGLLFHSLYDDPALSANYLSQGACLLINIDPQLFWKAWQQVIQHYEVLRSCFSENQIGSPQQIVYSQIVSSIRMINLNALSKISAEEAYQKILNQEIQTPFSLNEPPLMRFILCLMPEKQYRFIWTFHHLLCDLRSALQIFDHVIACYDALCHKHSIILPPITTKKEIIAKLPKVEISQLKAYWQKLFKDYESCDELPFIGSKNERIDYTSLVECHSSLAEIHFDILKEFAFKHKLTPSLVVNAAWGLTLCSYLNRNDIAFGSIRSLPYAFIKDSAGLFINNLPIRIRFDDQTTILDCLNDLYDQHRQLKQYWDSSLSDIQSWVGLSPGQNLFNTCVSFSTQESNELIKKHFDNYFQQFKFRSNTHYSIMVEFFIRQDRLLAKLTSPQGLLSQQMMESLWCQFSTILRLLINNPEKKICQLSWLTDKDYQQLNSWNRTTTSFPCDPISSLFEKQVLKTPLQIAVQFEDQQLTYMEFNALANRLANWLLGQGVKINVPIAVFMDQGLELPLALLAIIKAGGVYLPLDVRTPLERLRDILKDSQSPIIITTLAWQDKLKELIDFAALTNCKIFFLDQKDQLKSYPENNLQNVNHNDSNVYIIYTSGSTGKPKGVINHNRGLVNRLNWMKNILSIQSSDSVLQKTSISFDVSIWEFFLPWLVGAKAVFASSEILYDFNQLINSINQHQITTIHFVPTVLTAFLQHPQAHTCHSLRYIISSGEVLTNKTANQCLAMLPNARLYNLYGPTEASIDVSYHWYKERCNDQSQVPIGKPIDNTQLFVMNHYQQLVPIGGRGELYIGGIGVAKGYLNKSELTAEQFINNPLAPLFDTVSSEILYKTGDLVFWSLQGELNFIKRLDNQIKWHGFRIELDEIKIQMLTHPDITECILHVEEINHKPQIIAYYVTKNLSLAGAYLAEMLSQKLPHYMIPHYFIRLDHLPLLTNGKLDRNALSLPRQDLTKQIISETIMDSSIVDALLKIWKDVLQIENISIDDNLFSLGGDSITIMQIVNKARYYALVIKPKWIFENPTISKLSKYISNVRLPENSLLSISDKKTFLTPIQHWFFENCNEYPNYWQQYLLLTIENSFDVTILRSALDEVFSRHDVFRLRFKPNEKNQWQPIYIDKIEYAFESIQLKQILTKKSDNEIIDELLHNQANLINIIEGPLVRICFIEGSENKKQQLLFIVHHLIIDVISWQVLIEDLANVYAELQKTKSIANFHIKSPTWQMWLQYLAQLVNSREYHKNLLYWRDQAFYAKPLPLDFLAKEPAFIRTENYITHILPDFLTENLLKIFPQHSGISTEILLVNALVKTLTDWQKSPAISLDIESHGRPCDEIDFSHTIGWFTNIFPFSILLENQKKNMLENLMEFKEKWEEMKSYRLSYGILNYLSKSLPPSDAQPQLTKKLKKSEILFNYLGSLDKVSRQNNLFKLGDGNCFGQLRDKNSPQPYVFEIHIFVLDNKLRIKWIYNTALHSDDTILNLHKNFESNLKKIALSSKKESTQKVAKQTIQLPLTTQSFHIQKRYPLSPTQRGILFHSMSQSSQLFYMTQIALTISGSFKLELFREAWEEVILNVELLRTAFFIEKNGEPVQVVFKKVPLPFYFTDLRKEKKSAQKNKANRYLEKDRLTPFVMDIPPLFRLSLIALDEERYIFIYTCHHIISDGWSVSLLFKHLINRYYEKVTSRKMGRAFLYLPYVDYINQITKLPTKNAKKYWQNLLCEFDSPVKIDIDQSIFHEKLTGVLKFSRKKISFGNHLSRKIREIAKENQITLNILIQSLWTILLSRYSHQQKIVFGTVISGRSIDLDHIEERYGLFSKVIPTFVDLDKFDTIIPLCQFLLKQLAESESQSHYSLSHIQNDIYSGQSLFNYIVAFENYPVDASLSKLTVNFELKNIEVYETTHYSLNAFFFPGEDDITAEIVYDTRCFNKTAINRFVSHFKILLQSIVTSIDQPIHHLPLLSQSEQEKLLAFSNHFIEIESTRTTLNHLIELIAKKQPHKTAIKYHTKIITYAELIEYIELFSAHLYSHGARSGHTIALVFKHHPDIIIAMLACLKLGCTYLPVLGNSTYDYLEYLVNNSNAQFIVTNLFTNSVIVNNKLVLDKQVILTDYFYQKKIKKLNSSCFTPSSTAYIMYTSGSTGKSKGVAIAESSIIHLLHAINQVLQFGGNDAFVALSAYIFDISIVELFLPLIMGGECVLLPVDEIPLHSLLEYIKTTADHIFIQTTPSVWSHWLDSEFLKNSSFRIISTGEALPISLANRLLQEHGFIWNFYGPTETTIFATANKICSQENASQYSISSIGKPLETSRTYVFDEKGVLVPIGVTGELYIGGAGVMQGYIGQGCLLLNQEKLIPNPYKKDELLYKTGDKVCWLPDGNLQFLGRFDDQVKIRGFRVDLNQISSVLKTHPFVRDAIVLKQNQQSVQDVSASLRAYLLLEDKNILSSIPIDRIHDDQWTVIYEHLYQKSLAHSTFDTTGWVSSYTGKTFSKEDMLEWVQTTVNKIIALSPKKVLEIGCGMGLLLFPIAPLSESYHGTDISITAINHINKELTDKSFKNKVTLSQDSANTFRVSKETFYDTIILNSVIQYFSRIDYLIEVLDHCLNVASSGGQIFIGDVRSLIHLKFFHASVVMHRASPTLILEELRNRYFKYLDHEKELLIDPAFFLEYAQRRARISHVDIQLKRGQCNNEMNDYRYDVILHIEKPITSNPEVIKLDWQQEKINFKVLTQYINSSSAIYLANIPHPVWSQASQLINFFDHNDSMLLKYSELLFEDNKKNIYPGQLKQIIGMENYEIFYLFSAEKKIECFDAILYSRLPGVSDYLGKIIKHQDDILDIDWQHYGNKPWRISCYKKIHDILLQYLLNKFPYYMLPSSWILIDELPITVNGKLDTKALAHYRSIVTAEYQEANTEIEQTLIRIWQDTLGVHEIGVKDSFFQLGGHSLHALHIIHEITKQWSIDIGVSSLFETPTILELAQEIQKRLAQIPSGEESSSLVTFSSTGQKPPLFLVHPIGGTVFCYVPLVESLSIDHPIIGIQDPGITTSDLKFHNLSEMAKYYILLIKSQQPHGPYYLAGASFGGTLVVEIARQLTEQGEPINFIGMFDVWAAFTKEFNSRERLEKTLFRQYHYLKKQLKHSEIENPKPWLDLSYQRMQLLLQYQHPKIKQTIHLFKAQEVAPEFQDLNESTNHWSQYVTKSIKIYSVPGSHESILVEPNVKILAKFLTESLEAID